MSGTPGAAGEAAAAPPPRRGRRPDGGSRPGPGERRRRLADSLKSRMALVLGLVLLPAAAYAVLQAIAAYNDQSRQQAADLRHAAARVSAAYAEAATRLGQVAARPDLGGGRAGDPVAEAAAAVFPSCADLLRGELARAEGFFADLLLVDAAGRVACASADRLVGLDLAGAGWFREADGDGATGLRLGRAEGLSPAEPGTLVLAVPLRGDRDRFGGALAATLPPDRPLAGLELPRGTVARLVGRDGGPPAPADGAGRSASPTPDEIRQHLLDEPGTADLTRPGPDGGRFRFVAAPVAAEGGGSGLHALVGVPAPRWTWLGRELVLGLLVPVLTLALAVIAIWIATDYLVNRHVQALAAAARDYAAARHAGGGHAGWPALSDAPAELRDLAAVLADTTGELGAREAELEASLRHKELLLREVHHRVRNNLQVVTSLLNLRAQAAAAASPAARDALIEAQARVKALALVHRDLYEGDEPGAVELRSLLGELCALLEDTVSGRLTGAAAAVDVAVRVELAPARVAVDRAVPVALFLTEALSNALRHAFPGDGSGGTVSVRLVRDEAAAGTATLTVEDDGIGLGSLPPGAGRVDGAGRAAAGGLGMTLMRMLAGQAGGRLQLGPAREDGTGTRVGLDFPLAAAATATAARRPNGGGGDAPSPSGPAAVPPARGFPEGGRPRTDGEHPRSHAPACPPPGG